MKASTLMIQGTTSDAGKSLVVAALCRLLSNNGVRVTPFKGQNMALNSFATIDGGEIGRAQALQAEAARIEPTVDMNPVLLKPTGNAKSQVIVLGKVRKTLTARDYYAEKTALVKIVEESLNSLRERFDVVVIEGAGSPAEINLKHDDIANMGVAKMVKSPVLLVGDIDRGGVFASLVGTIELLESDEKALIKGIIINKFRGDETLLDDGIEFLKERTGISYLGTIPYIPDLKIDSEDSLALDDAGYKGFAQAGKNLVDVAVVRLDQISNFTDFDALAQEPGVNLRYINPAGTIGDTDCVIIPGSKNTIADLRRLYETGIAEEIVALSKSRVPVIGICGGYQMLGQSIEDPRCIESDIKFINGLGLLDCKTVLTEDKTTEQVEARVVDGTSDSAATGHILSRLAGEVVQGYEIHMGETAIGPNSKEAFQIIRRGRCICSESGGAMSRDGFVLGTYIHGLFDNDKLRSALVDYLGGKKGVNNIGGCKRYSDFKQAQIEKLAKAVGDSLDMDYIFRLLGLVGARV